MTFESNALFWNRNTWDIETTSNHRSLISTVNNKRSAASWLTQTSTVDGLCFAAGSASNAMLHVLRNVVAIECDNQTGELRQRLAGSRPLSQSQ